MTPNAGGEDLVEEGITGYLVPIRSPEKLANAISALFANWSNKEEVQKICQNKAEQYSWASYAQNIIDFNLSNPSQMVEIR